MTVQERARRKTPRVIDVGRDGKPRKRWKQHAKRALDVTIKVITAFVFIRNWGWKAFAGVFAIGAVLSTWLWPDDNIVST